MMPWFFGLLLTLLVTPALIRAAYHYGWLDHPDERKHHTGAVPMVGGLAISFAFVVSAAWYLAGADIFWGLLTSVSIIVVLGFLDDQNGLSVRLRFFAQGIAGLIMALFAGAQLANLGDVFGFGPVALGALTVPFTILSVVGVVNAINLADGMDGLAGGLVLISTAFLATAAYFTGDEITLNALLILGGALVGFLYFNMRFPWQSHARVFLGDCGSLMLGFLLTWAAIRVTQAERNSLPPAAALWFFAIPLLDTVSLMLHRMLKGKSPFCPDRDHLHHILLHDGYTDSQVVLFIHLAAVVFGLVGFLGWRWGVPVFALFYGFLVVFAVYFYAVKKRLRNAHRNPDTARLIRADREDNDHKPHYVVDRICQAASTTANPVIACFGLAFKPDIDYLRECPAVEIIHMLANSNLGDILVVGSNIQELPQNLSGVENLRLVSANEALFHANIVVMLVNHHGFYDINLGQLADKQIIDTRGVWQ